MRNSRSICKWKGLLVLAVCLLVACSLWRSGDEGGESQRPEPQETFDPFAYEGDADIITDVAYIDTSEIVDSSLFYIAGEEAPNYPSEVYRVQLFASQSYYRALEEQGIATEVFDEPIRINYSTPFYRVEMGNFPNLETADSMLRLAKSRGYSKCWIITEPVDSLFWIGLEADSLQVDSTGNLEPDGAQE